MLKSILNVVLWLILAALLLWNLSAVLIDAWAQGKGDLLSSLSNLGRVTFEHALGPLAIAAFLAMTTFLSARYRQRHHNRLLKRFPTLHQADYLPNAQQPQLAICPEVLLLYREGTPDLICTGSLCSLFLGWEHDQAYLRAGYLDGSALRYHLPTTTSWLDYQDALNRALRRHCPAVVFFSGEQAAPSP